MTSTQETPLILTGQVKWFNNKAGYGFITVNSGEHSGKEVFIHYSAIRLTNSQYKYLVQGEYVEFTLEKTNNDKYEYQANNISGINGGKLMCETRSLTRTIEHVAAPRRHYRVTHEHSTNSNNSEEGFVQVQKKRNPRSVVNKHQSSVSPSETA